MPDRLLKTAARPSMRPMAMSHLSVAVAIGMALLYGPGTAHAQQSTSPTSQDAPAPAAAPAKKTDDKTKDKQPVELGAVNVTGVRASLQSAQQIKQNADQIVDSIVATDIGKLPDSNVAEALQRISGIQIDRNYGEGSTIAIRGLTQVRTEVNGRDSFTANGGRALSFEDVPSELLAGIDVYKNPSAEIIEGGLGGTVNLRTHLPFDFAGQKAAVTAEYDYADLAKKGRPSASALYSNRWNTDLGEFGVLVDLAYQKHAFRQDVISTEPFYSVVGSPNDPSTNYPGYEGRQLYVPHGGGVGETYGDRRRIGTSLALQWRPNDKTELYLQALRSDYTFKWRDYSYFAYTSADPIIPSAGYPFVFGPTGDFESGTFSNVGVGSNSSLATRRSKTTDISWGGSYQASNNLTLTTDFQYIKATTEELRYILGTTTTAPNFTQDISGGLPTLTVTGANGQGGVLTDPNNAFYGFALDHKDQSTGREFAWRADGEYTFDSDFFQTLKFGIRTTDRKATTESTPYRFTGIFQPLTNFPTSSWVVNNYSDFFRGDANVFGATIAPNPALLNDYPNSLSMFGVTTPLTYGPADINRQGEKTYTAYGMLRFGWHMGEVPVDGNFGVRGVRTKVTANAVMTDPSGSGAYLPLNVDNSYNSALPSLNINVHFTDKLQWRIAASKSISRPSFDDMNPFLSLSTPDATGGNSYTGSAGNPNLKPMKADQFDTSLEWYFKPTGMVYGALFYKNVNGFIAHGVFNETYDGNVYQVSRPVNGGNGKIRGAELGTTYFFDFLPHPFDGLGVQANYTYVYSKAPSPDAFDTSGNPLQVPLEGLSKNSYNLIGIYEKGPIEARLAYNWRSNWVETTAGNGTGNLPIFDKAYGQLDASLTYHVTSDFSLTGAVVNATNTKRRTMFGLETRPRDVQINDRMYSLKAMYSF